MIILKIYLKIVSKHFQTEISSENILCLLRANGIENAYDIVREITQNKKFNNIDEFMSEIKNNEIINKTYKIL